MDFSLQVILHEFQKKEQEWHKDVSEDGGNTHKEPINIVCSPLGIAIMLNMLAIGAEGQTLEQLLEHLKLENIEEANSNSLKLLKLVEKSCKGKSKICFVIGFLLDKEFSIKPSYQVLLKEVYGTEAMIVDFNQQEKMREEANAWASELSDGLIKKLLPQQKLDKLEMLILANAFYFKALWKSPFKRKMTEDKTFHLLSGKRIKLPFMHQFDERYKYSSFDGYKALKMPYKGNLKHRRFSMLMLLPNEIKGLPNLLHSFASNPKFLHQVDKKLKEASLSEIRIPKFKFSYNFTPSEVIKELGLTMPFKPEAELGGVVEYPNLFVSSITQTSWIEVNEKGTEVVVQTTKTFAQCEPCCPPELKLEFIADHPFMFVINEDVSGAILVVGMVLNPLPR